jgi:hypothetical protein
LLNVAVPGAGQLSAKADAAVTIATGPTHKRKTARKRSAHGRRASAAGTRKTVRVATREIARATATAKGPEVLQLYLRPASRYRSLLNANGGLYTTVVVTFKAAGHHLLSQTLHASFPRPHPIYPLYKVPSYKLPKHKQHPRKHKGKHPAGGGKHK